MQLYRRLFLFGVCLFACVSCFAATLTFVAQPVSGGIDNTWFNAINWFTTDSSGNLQPAGRVPQADEAAIITGTVDLQASGVRVATLLATNNAAITNGTLAVENLQLLGGTSIKGVTVNVLTALIVGGTNCTLNATTLNILSIASGTLQAIPPATACSLVLTQGSTLSTAGALSLSDRSQISGGGLPQSKLIVQAGALLVSSGSTEVIGSTAGHLVIDNSGVIRVDAGSLVFSNAIDWQSSAGLGEFRAAGPSSMLLFGGSFHVTSNVMSVFTGVGTNRWLSGATIDGVAQVSALDSTSQLAGLGTLEFTGPVSGAGTLHVLGTTNQGGFGVWDSGQLSVPGVAVDPGATLLIGGASDASCQLAGCTVTNLGECIFAGGDFNFSQSAVLNNKPSAIFAIEADGTFSSSLGGGVLNNFGTFEKLSAGTTAFIFTNSVQGPDFNNTGLLDLRSGQLNLLGGASSGEFRQSQGALCWFWGGTHALDTGASFTGPGAVRLSQGTAPAKWLLNDSLNVVQLEVGGNGTVDSSALPTNTSIQIGTLATHDNALITNGTFQIGAFQMLDQTLVASATLEIGNSATVGGTNCALAGSELLVSANASALFQSPTGGAGVNLILSGGAVLQDAGQCTLGGETSIIGGSGQSSSVIIQSGGVLLCTNSGACIVSADFSNSGKLEVQSGTLAFQGAWNQLQGTTMVDSGATLAGTKLTILGGTVSGTGTIAADLANAGGTLSPGAPLGVLSIGPTNHYQQAAAGNLAVALGGLAPPSQLGQLYVGGAASLDGQLVVSFLNGFTPQSGQVFQILTAGSITGRFANVSAPSPVGNSWFTRYASNSVTLVLAANENLPRPMMSGGTLTFPITTTAGLTYQVQATGQLNPPNWQVVGTISGDGTVKTFSEAPTQPARFYRILLQ